MCFPIGRNAILGFRNQLWLSTCVKQAITLRGKILESLSLTIVMVALFGNDPCALNRDDGSYLPQEYLHLVGR